MHSLRFVLAIANSRSPYESRNYVAAPQNQKADAFLALKCPMVKTESCDTLLLYIVFSTYVVLQYSQSYLKNTWTELSTTNTVIPDTRQRTNLQGSLTFNNITIYFFPAFVEEQFVRVFCCGLRGDEMVRRLGWFMLYIRLVQGLDQAGFRVRIFVFHFFVSFSFF